VWGAVPAKVNIVSVVSLDSLTETHTIIPKTVVFKTATATDDSQDFDRTEGYTLILFDEEAADIEVKRGIGTGASSTTVGTSTNDLINFSSTVVRAGFEFIIIPKAVTATRNTKITVFGNETGVTKTISLTIVPTS